MVEVSDCLESVDCGDEGVLFPTCRAVRPVKGAVGKGLTRTRGGGGGGRDLSYDVGGGGGGGNGGI